MMRITDVYTQIIVWDLYDSEGGDSMSGSSENTKSSAIKSIVVAVFITLLVGGSAPWWWGRLFPEQPRVEVPSDPKKRQPEQPRVEVPSDPKKMQPYMGPLEGGTTRNGGDLSKVGIQANSAAECSDLCAANESCKAMTFVKHSDANGGICWTKGSVPSPSDDQAMVSAIKMYPK